MFAPHARCAIGSRLYVAWEAGRPSGPTCPPSHSSGFALALAGREPSREGLETLPGFPYQRLVLRHHSTKRGMPASMDTLGE